MKRFTGVILSLILLVSVLSGCGTEPSGSGASAPVSPSAEQSPQASDDSKASDASWPRTITDASGHEVTLEKEPERITLLHTYPMEYFFALGVPPTASTLGNSLGQSSALADSELYAPYLTDSGILDLGSAREINLEAVLESNPDVIVTFASHKGVDELYDQLTAIAPVVLIDYTASWQDQLTFCAKIVGKETEVQSVIADIDGVITDAKQALSGYSDRTVALFRTDGKAFITRGDAVYYNTFGLAKPEGFGDTTQTVSLEAVAEMNPYYIVFQHNYAASVAFVESMAASAVWQSLDAVKNGRIYYFDENMNTFGPLTLRLAAEKLTVIYNGNS